MGAGEVHSKDYKYCYSNCLRIAHRLKKQLFDIVYDNLTLLVIHSQTL